MTETATQQDAAGDTAIDRIDIDWDGADFATRARAVYAQLREMSPIVRDDRQVTVFRREHVEEVLRDPRTFSSRPEAQYLGAERPLIPLQLDPPEHTRFRKLLDPLFGPRQVAALEPGVTALVESLLDGVADRGTCDLAADFTVPLPSLVFLSVLGLPTDGLPRFLELKEGIISPTGTHEERAATRARTGEQIYGLFAGAVEERLAAPREDLISKLLAMETDGTRLTVEEVLDICFLFLLAGLDTVTAALQCFLVHLAQHPADRQLLLDDPGAVDDAVEELLRWESPVSAVSRVATRDTTVGGCPVRAGQPVNVLLGAANTDEAELPDPHIVDLRRERNRHIAFGRGPHRCLGSHLARLELRVGLAAWLRRFPRYRLAEGAAPEFVGSVRHLRGPVPVVLDAGPR